jgi:hypothetical protein
LNLTLANEALPAENEADRLARDMITESE